MPPHDNVHDAFLNGFLNSGMTQFVVDFTRFNSNGVGTILDIVLCNDPLAVISNSSKDPFSTSDYSVIDFTLFVPTECDMQTSNVDFVSIKIQLHLKVCSDQYNYLLITGP